MTTLPNAISLMRLVIAPVGLLVAWRGAGDVYKALFTLAVASDLIDGVLARHLGQDTEFGAKLDTWADSATYAALFFSVLLLWPEFVASHAGLLTACLALYAFVFSLAFLRFRKLPSYHSWGGKLSAVLMGASILLWFYTGNDAPFRLALIVALAAGLDELAITLVLPDWRANVPSAWHAYRQTASVEH